MERVGVRDLRARCDKWVDTYSDATRTSLWVLWAKRRIAAEDAKWPCDLCKRQAETPSNPKLLLCDCSLSFHGRAHLECILARCPKLACTHCGKHWFLGMPFDPKHFIRTNCDIVLPHVTLRYAMFLNYGGTVLIASRRNTDGRMCMCVVPKSQRVLYEIDLDTASVQKTQL